ncbi:hypothetical protein CAPN006_07300 [Capnocytophaga canimorsus]|uniref:glycosyltransferase n=1 Tax=Capnocytophaga canimorsus TaxID=28188 RepID=UPI001AD28267|nr:glycosyltransferase [Capnocytophaga canimorsus]GIM56336.1 hypothetical protein CAPN006_07300 [Capnocytophaga canimorsus]
MKKYKLIRTATIPASLKLLKGQLAFLNQYFEVIAVSGEDENLHEVKQREAIRVYPIEMQRRISPIKDFISLIKLYLYFRKEKPYIVHSITPKAGLLTMLAGKMAGVPMRIHTFTGLIFPSKEGITQKLLIQMDRLLCWAATNIYPEGQGVKNDLINYKITSKPLKVIANGNVNGINTEHFCPKSISNQESQQLKKTLNVQSDDFVFIFVGRLVRDKGINELITAFSELKLPNAKLLLVGEEEKDLDPLEAKTIEEILQNENIIKVGFQKDVRPYFAISDCLAFPSYREGFPNVVMEAGAMGLPSVVTNINGCNEIIVEGENGLIVPTKSVGELKKAMRKMREDQSLYQSLQQNSRRMIVERYQQEMVWQVLLEEYNELIKEMRNMRLGEFIRNKVYFFLDKLKSSVVKNKIDELSVFEQLSEEEKHIISEKKLQILTEDVKKNVPFYKEKNFFELKDFPIVNKKIIAENPTLFYSEKYQLEHLVPVRTSGSYGTPLTYYLTKDKKKRQLAEVIHFGRKSGYDVGICHGYFRSNPHKTKLKFWMQNETFFASKKLDDKFVKFGLNALKKKKIKSLIGFPSSISYLAQYCTEQGFKPKDFSVRGVITSSENLTVNQREIINRAFGCPIHSRYSTEELGVLGNQYDAHSGFEMNTCNYIIEVLKLDSDKSAEIGEIGRIVVTDLHSNAMPLIRYEVGDLGKVERFLCNGKKWVSKIATLSGRVIQIIYNTQGTPLYPLYLDSVMENYDFFIQHQLIQETQKKYTLNLVLNTYQYSKEDIEMEKILRDFYDWLGADAQISVNFVDDIEKLSSGKRPYIINRYKDFSI